MKQIALLSVLISLSVFSQTPCENGFAGEYPCHNVELLSNIPLSTFGATRGNDSWGWTDSETGKEYVIYGNTNNAAFIDISDPINPVYLGKINANGNTSTWRDIKVYNNYAFVVSENSNHGMQVFDLTRLRNVTNPPVIFTEDAHYSGFGNAHNIVINEENGYAYGVGTNTFNGGIHFVNIQNPLSPSSDGGYSIEGYTHDAQVITYNGPDTEHNGKEIFIGSNLSSIVFVDVTDKNNPTTISEFFYANANIAHQSWIDADHTYLYIGDEGDESSIGFNTRTIACDLTDLDNPVLKTTYFGPTSAIDHNNYVHQDKLYIANYSAGLRVVDVSDIENGNMNEVAFFDSFPSNNNVNFNGAWNVYPFFESGNIMISDRERGVFIVRLTGNAASVNNAEINSIEIFPNPVNNLLTINSKDTAIQKVEVLNIIGKKVIQLNNLDTLNRYQLDVSNLNEGLYFIKINNSKFKKFLKK